MAVAAVTAGAVMATAGFSSARAATGARAGDASTIITAGGDRVTDTAVGGLADAEFAAKGTLPRGWYDNPGLGRGGAWASRNDPPAPAVCGLRVALLFDLSSSITTPVNHLAAYKAAGVGFVNALRGTPASVGVYTFATSAPAANTSGVDNANLPLTPVSTDAGVDAVNAKINGLGVPSGSHANWDAGLWQIASGSTSYDAVIVLTDGDPTRYGPGGAGGLTPDTSRFPAVENGIFSANALKHKGTKVIAVGIGATSAGSTASLRAISGTAEDDDYFTTSFGHLARVLKGIAAEQCDGTINVVKQVISGSEQGTIDAASPAPGWTFTAAVPSVTGASGGVSFKTGRSTTPTTVTETPMTGYTLFPPGRPPRNATCVDTTTGATVDAANVTNGFTVTPDPEGIISCTVYSQQPATDPDPASVVIDKTWVINGKTFDEGDQDPDFRSALTLGPTHPAGTPANWGEVYEGYEAGDTVGIGESATIPAGCRNTASGDVGTRTLAAGLNAFHVTNTVTCTSRLTMVREISNPYPGLRTAPLDPWTLEASPGPGLPPAVAGASGVTGTVTANTRYVLSESGAQGYRPRADPDTTLAAGAAGSWDCQQILGPDDEGLEDFGGSNGTVMVPLGVHAQCTVVNIPQPARLTLVKKVVNVLGGYERPADWTLTARPLGSSASSASSASALPASTVRGTSGADEVTVIVIPPGTRYSLSESGPPAYKLTGLTCTGGLRNGVLVAVAGESITCTFTNTQVKPLPLPILPVTG